METKWQSHREHESGALGQPLVFKDRRGSRMPGRLNLRMELEKREGGEDLFVSTGFQLWAVGQGPQLYSDLVLWDRKCVLAKDRSSRRSSRVLT